MKTKLQLILLSVFSLCLSSTCFSQSRVPNGGSTYFNVGMFSVAEHFTGAPQPGTQEFRDELQSLWQGTEDEYSAINTLHVYGHYIEDTTFWTAYLNDISIVSDNIKTLGDCQFNDIDEDNDSLISQIELDNFVSFLEKLLVIPNSDHIAGWYIADEPTSHEFEPVEVDKIYNAIKQRDDRPIYIAEAPEVPGVADYSLFRCDILMIDDYYYSINGYTDLGTLAWWRDLITGARADLKAVGRENTEIHAILVLGEEFFPDTLNENLVASHGLTHSAIRTVLELGVDGIWFYAWRAGVLNTDDAVDRWIDQQNYAEAVETEIHDKDYLISAFNSQNNSKIYVSDIGNGQAPDEGTNFIFTNMINGLASGDLQGSNDLDGNQVLFDLPYRIDEGYRSNGDGDDELITFFDNGNIYFNEKGDQPDQLLINSVDGSLLAITSGDYDGDGDNEIATALHNGNQCNIYVTDDGAAGSIMQYQIYSSNNYKVTALTSGDFNENGRDELVTALSDSQFKNTYIYVDDISVTGTVATGTPWFGPDNTYHVTALTSGDFNDDNIFKDRLIFALSDSNMSDTRIYYTDINSFSFDSSQIFFGPDNYWHITSMSFGDYFNDDKTIEDLVIALSNSSFDHTQIYKTNDPVNNGIGSLIYDPGFPSEYYVAALTSASFRESLHPVTSIEDQDPGNNDTLLNNIYLFQNYPNPFNPVTIISFTISGLANDRQGLRFTILKVYDILGQEAETLIDEEIPAGTYQIEFNGNHLPSGVYFYQLIVDRNIITNKMVLLK